MLQPPDPTGEILTRVTIWFAFTGYASGLILFYYSRARAYWDRIARYFWTFGCVALIAHIACAFHFYHQWSHRSAYQETAVLTSEVYGVYWGGGVFINYLLMIAWMSDVIWWWTGLERYRNRPKWISIGWHAFVFFIFFNATVIFEDGVIRVIGLGFTLAMIVMAMMKIRAPSPSERDPSAGYRRQI